MRGSLKIALEQQIEASQKVIADAGLMPKGIDGVIPIGIVSGTADDFIENFGTPDSSFSAIVPHSGVSPVTALWAVAHHAFHPAFAGKLSYVLVTVDVDEGVRALGRRTAPGIGQRVISCFEVHEETPAEATKEEQKALE